MKKLLFLGAMVAGLALFGATNTAQADHMRGGFRGGWGHPGWGGWGYGHPGWTGHRGWIGHRQWGPPPHHFFPRHRRHFHRGFGFRPGFHYHTPRFGVGFW
jgi:hypothetical protein